MYQRIMLGLLRYSGRLFHTIGPDAVREHRPYVNSLTGGTTSLLLSEDLRQWRDDLVDAGTNNRQVFWSSSTKTAIHYYLNVYSPGKQFTRHAYTLEPIAYTSRQVQSACIQYLWKCLRRYGISLEKEGNKGYVRWTTMLFCWVYR